MNSSVYKILSHSVEEDDFDSLEAKNKMHVRS